MKYGVGETPRRKKMSWRHRIVLDPNILVGKPVVKTNGLSVEFVIDLLAEG